MCSQPILYIDEDLGLHCMKILPPISVMVKKIKYSVRNCKIRSREQSRKPHCIPV